MKPLRDYQQEALDAVRASVGQGIRRLCLQAPTGSGKTVLAAAIVAGAQSKGNRLTFVVPSISLIDQTVEMFAAQGIRDNIGVIQADHPLTDWAKPIQVASIQTIKSRGVYPESKAVIIDECHTLHQEHVRWMGHLDKETGKPVGCPGGWENVPFIGLSATPWTRGLGRFFQTLQVMSTTSELIKEGYLSPFQVFASDHPDLSKVKTRGADGDYVETDLSVVMNDKALTANIIKTWTEKWGRDKTLLFAVDCAHAKALQARFLEAGVSCAYQDAQTPRKERQAIKDAFHRGEYRVIANVGTLTTGVDFDVRCLILARPTRSEILLVQIIGRALRTAPGKDKAIILDHTSTTERLGLVTDIHHEYLNGGRFDDANKVIRHPPLPKPCPKCTCLIPVGVKTCPSCGFERKAPVSGIYEKEGVLVPFTGTFRKKGDRRAPTYTMEEKARFYAQLKGYALEKGYRSGWAFYKYKEKFNAEPPWSLRGMAAMAPGPEVKQWLTHLAIEWAKSPNNPKNQRRDNPQGSFL